MSEVNIKIISSKFHFFEKVKLTDKIFSWKIAFLNTAAFCLIASVDTYNLQHIKTPFECPWGYWILLWSIVLVLGNYFLSRTKRWIIQVCSPFLFTIGIGCFVSIINFRTPSGSFNFVQMLVFILTAFLSLVTSVIRYYILHADKETNLSDLTEKARISWITESINMWRTLAITILTVDIVFIIFWLKSTWDWADSAFVGEQQGITKGLIAIEAAGIALYVFFGPFFECFRKAEHIRNMLLDIKK